MAGVDEVGRGCLAGPVFAAAVTLNNNINGAQIGSGALGTTGGGGADFTDAAEALIGAIDNVVNKFIVGMPFDSA